MGSFNAACSISNLSINCGDPVAFIPLLPGDRNAKLPRDHMLIYPNALYNPVCLPIFGEYNDYGGVENIIKDKNTELVEAWIKMPIDKFVGYITNGRRDIDDSYGSPVGFFAEPEKIKYITQFTEEYKFGKDWLKVMGFVEEEDNKFVWPGANNFYVSTYEAEYTDRGKTYSTPSFIIYYEGVEIDRGRYHYPRSDFLKSLYQHTGIIPYVPEEHWKKIELLNDMSGMFVHKNIYDTFIGSHDKLDLWLGERNKPERIYEDFQKKAVEANENDEDFFVDFVLSQTPLMYHFKEWPFFNEIYQQSIIQGKLKDEVCSWIYFHSAMFSCNRFFFPAMNGEQFGNIEASKLLLEASLEILKKEEEEMDDF